MTNYFIVRIETTNNSSISIFQIVINPIRGTVNSIFRAIISSVGPPCAIRIDDG